MGGILKLTIIEKNRTYQLEVISFKHLAFTLQAVKEKYRLNKVNILYKGGNYLIYVK